MKIYRQHKCERRHRTYTTFAECAWKKRGIPVHVSGDGPYASVSRCNDDYSLPSYRQIITVYLYDTAEEATAAKKLIDETMCGGLCRRNHEVVQLELPT